MCMHARVAHGPLILELLGSYLHDKFLPDFSNVLYCQMDTSCSGRKTFSKAEIKISMETMSPIFTNMVALKFM
jgi:hypothetical protein